MYENENVLGKVTPDSPYYTAVIALLENQHPRTRPQIAGEPPQMEEIAKQEDNLRFGLALKLARRSRGLSQKDLAEKAGLDHSYISKIEQGKYPPPSREATLALAKILDFSDRTDRLYFMLFAGRAALDDIQGTKFEQIVFQSHE